MAVVATRTGMGAFSTQESLLGKYASMDVIAAAVYTGTQRTKAVHASGKHFRRLA